MRSAKGWLYLPVEVKVRELDAKLLLAYYAVKEGYRVIIGEHKMVELASTFYPKGIFFSKGYPRGFRKRIITNAKNNGHIVVELDEEGLLINDTVQYLKSRMVEDMLYLVTQEYCWGNLQKQIITRAYPKTEQKCFVVGNPRFDLLTPKFNGIYKKDAENIRNKYGEFVLINTRFSTYNSLQGFQINNKHPMNIYFKELYDRFIEMIKFLCKKNPRINFVIRPHPGESFESYNNELSSLKNAYVIHEGNIIKWLMAASVVIHNGCTSSIEASLLRKPIISYIPISSKKYDVELPDLLGMKASTILEVNNYLKDMLNKNENPIQTLMNEKRERLSDYYRFPENQFSYESILSLLNSISLSSATNNNSIPQKNLYIKENKSVKHFFPSLTKKEIVDFFKNLDAIERYSSNFQLRGIGRNLFEIKLA